MPRFLGLDLAWHRTGNTSALAVLEGDEVEVHLHTLYPSLRSDTDIIDAIRASTTTTTILAIDAPLVIGNATGQRACEKLIGRKFGRADAAAHTSNLERFPSARGVMLAATLECGGWRHLVGASPNSRRRGNGFFEVYPHPAHVVLFDLERIVKYKKGKVAARRIGLRRFRDLIQAELRTAVPSLIASPSLSKLLDTNLDALRGRALKQFEDSLDAVLCGYLAAHFWAWGDTRNEVLGTLSDGYIVVPSSTVRGTPWRFGRAYL